MWKKWSAPVNLVIIHRWKQLLRRFTMETTCTLYPVPCNLCSVLCTLYSVPCTLYSVSCTLYSVPWITYQMTNIPKATHCGLSINMGRASSSSSSGSTGTSLMTVVRRLIWNIISWIYISYLCLFMRRMDLRSISNSASHKVLSSPLLYFYMFVIGLCSTY